MLKLLKMFIFNQGYQQSQRRSKGMVLVLTLWILSLLAIFAIALSLRSATSIKVAKNMNARIDSYYLAKSGINYAKDLISAEDPSIDHLGEDWAQEISEEFDSGKFELNIIDENRKICLNKLAEYTGGPSLPIYIDNGTEILMTSFGQSEPGLAMNILDWIDADMEKRGGLNEDEDPSLYMIEAVKDSNLLFIDELLFVDGMSSSIFSLAKDKHSVQTDSINVNTVDIAEGGVCPVLSDLGALQSFIDWIAEQRSTNGFIDSWDDPILFDQQPQIVQELLTFNSNVFLISSKGFVENQDGYYQIDALFNRDQGIVNWKQQYFAKAQDSEEDPE